jgi:hypothetical protein
LRLLGFSGFGSLEAGVNASEERNSNLLKETSTGANAVGMQIS